MCWKEFLILLLEIVQQSFLSIVLNHFATVTYIYVILRFRFFKITWKVTKLSSSSLWHIKDKNRSLDMPQTRVQYLCNFLCNRKKKITEFVSVHGSSAEGVKWPENSFKFVLHFWTQKWRMWKVILHFFAILKDKNWRMWRT